MNQDSEWDEPKQPQRPRTIFGALLFPANRTGLAHIGIYTVCLMLLGLVRSVMIGILGIGVSFINLIVAIEMVNYLRYCLRQSACGAVTAPDSLLIDSFDVGGVSATLGGYFSLVAEYLAMIIPVLICFLPAILYSVLTERLDLIFIILLAAGIFYFPI